MLPIFGLHTAPTSWCDQHNISKSHGFFRFFLVRGFRRSLFRALSFRQETGDRCWSPSSSCWEEFLGQGAKIRCCCRFSWWIFNGHDIDDLDPWVRNLGFRTRNVIELFGSHVGTKPWWMIQPFQALWARWKKILKKWYFGKATWPRWSDHCHVKKLKVMKQSRTEIPIVYWNLL